MEKIFSVTEFVEFINIYLQQIDEVWVEGEISSIQISQNKWLFISIKDKNSVISVFGVVYKINNYRLLSAGMMVKIRGIPKLHNKSGKFSLFAEQILPSGEGALRLAFERLKAQLETEGLFDTARKRALPAFPQKIGLITARQARALTDFIKVLNHRIGGVTIYFYPVAVQGQEAVPTLVAAFDYFNSKMADLDLLVVTRGGGSLEDLQAFNDERVVRAVFGSSIPVVSAVGHEEDVSLSDMAADLRASTPSNAAELIVKSRSELLGNISFQLAKIDRSISQVLNGKKNQLSDSIYSLERSIRKQINSVENLIRRLATVIDIFNIQIVNQTGKVLRHATLLSYLINAKYITTKNALLTLTRLLSSLDYKNVLKRGFSISLNSSQKVIKTSDQVAKDEPMTTVLFSGKIYSQVTTKE